MTDEMLNNIVCNGVIDYEKLISVCNELSVAGGELLKSLIPNNKKVLMIYGNCHTLFYYQFCNRSPAIKNAYIILKIPPIQAIKLQNTVGGGNR